MELLLFAVVAVALFFDFTNGFHDSANSIATSVSTRALSPRTAVDQRRDPELPRGLRVLRGRGDDRERDRRPGGHHAGHRPRRPRRCDHVEPHHLVPRASLELEPRAHRRDGRLRRCRRGPRRRPVGGAVGQGAHPVVARARHGGAPCRGTDDPRALDHPEARARHRESHLPAAPAPFRRLRRLHARHERRPEDDGDHRARARRVRAPLARLRAAAAVGDRELRDRDGPSAPTPAAGGSSRRSGRASRSSSRRRGSLRRPRAPASS